MKKQFNKPVFSLTIIFFIFLFFSTFGNVIAGIIPHSIYLPLVQKSKITIEPSPSPTPTYKPTSPPIIATTGDIQIATIFYDGVVSFYKPDE